jgi:hypothetical protein
MESSDQRQAPGRDGLRVRDRLQLRLHPLTAEQARAVQNGSLGAQSRGPARGGDQAATVEDLLAGFPRDQQLAPPLAESLKLLDAKLTHLLNLLEDQRTAEEEASTAEVSVIVGLEEAELFLTGAETGVSLPEAGQGGWLEMVLPGVPRTLFGVPVTAGEPEELGADHAPARWRVALRLHNVTETEEQALSEYLFRRHRQEVRQWRGRESPG